LGISFHSGGYNVGDKTASAFNTLAPTGTIGLTDAAIAGQIKKVLDVTDNANTQYQMTYIEGSKMSVEWTNQHGCGGDGKS
jgi:hypothetical protein